MRHYCFNILLIFVFLVFSLLFWSNSANAALILNRPNYTGLNQGLVGYWSFDGKDVAGIPSTATSPGTVYDRSGQGNNGLYYNATGTRPVTGKLGQALSFDGADDFASITNESNFDFQYTDDFSISGWVYMRPTAGYVFFKRNAAGVGYELYANTSGEGIVFNLIAGGGNDLTLNAGTVVSQNEWHHIAATYDGSGTSAGVKLYLDGVKKTNTVVDEPITATILNNALPGIASNVEHADFVNQLADEVRVYDRVLTADEIKRLYRIGGTLHVNTGDLGKNDTLQKGLVGYWSFDGKDTSGTVAYDRSGQGNNGTLTNGPVRTFGKLGQALEFDGVDDFVIKNTPNGMTYPGQVTFSAWIYLKAWGSLGTIIQGDEVATGPFRWRFQVDNNGVGNDRTIRFNTNWDTDGVWTAPADSISLLRWHHVVAEYDESSTSNNPTIYIDGISQTVTVETAPVGALGSDITDFCIGARCLILARPFNGKIDELRVYNRLLSADEIKRLYRIGGTLHVNTGDLGKNDTLQKGLVGYWSFDGKDTSGTVAYDRSGQGNNGTLTNGPVRTFGKLGQALSFDGVNDYVDIADIVFGGTSPISICTWMKPNDVRTKQRLIEQGNEIQLTITETNQAVFVLNSFTTNDRVTISTGAFDVGKWFHYCGVYHSGGEMIIYIDSIKRGSVIPTGTYADDVTPFSISDRDLTEPFSGTIDDLRIYNRALSADEIKRLYNLGR